MQSANKRDGENINYSSHYLNNLHSFPVIIRIKETTVEECHKETVAGTDASNSLLRLCGSADPRQCSTGSQSVIKKQKSQCVSVTQPACNLNMRCFDPV